MRYTSDRPADDVKKIIDTYGNMLFRLCLVTLGNASDAEDAVQETLIRYLQKAPDFAGEEHEKSWLMKVAVNICRDMLRFRNRHPLADIDEMKEYTKDTSDSGVFEALMTLPDKYRTVLALYYVEEYKIREIAKIMEITASAVKMRLQKGRRLLEEAYRRGYM